MSELDQISRLLAERFSRNGERGRIVFWRDEKNQYADTVEGLVGESASVPVLQDVRFIRIEHNPFNVRYRMFREAPTAKFLVYVPEEEIRPTKDDWLLDLELAYGPVFSADKLSMIATEVLPTTTPDTQSKWLDVMRRTTKFFDSDSRVNKLSALLNASDDEKIFQAKMIAVLLGLRDGKHSLQDIWRALLEQYADGDESGIMAIERMGLSEFHWTGTGLIYRYEPASGGKASVKDFMLWLFRLAWQGFITESSSTDVYANIRRDFESWRNDRTFEDAFKALSDEAADDLMIHAEVQDLDIDELLPHGVFRAVDSALIGRMYERLAAHSLPADMVRKIIAERRSGLWFSDFRAKYEAIAAASVLRRELDDGPPLIDDINSAEQGFVLYRDRLYAVDQAYRRFTIAWRSADDDVPVIRQELENSYTTFQRALGQAWQQQIDTLSSWTIDSVPSQRDFYRREVQPRIKSGKKIAVIISDALRYEVAEELSDAISAENRYSAGISAQCSVLPSYTQLGMAALLPHDTLSLSESDHYRAVVDGHSATGTENRDGILNRVDGHAIQYDDFMALDRDGARDLVKSCNTLYVYHNRIDAVGDSDKTESGTFDACSQAIDELVKIIKKLANANVSNMIVTADHGFLYQDHDVENPEWLSEQPQGDEVWVKARRFSVGRNLAPNRAFITFTGEQLGLTQSDKGLTVQIPNSILRLRKQGTGVRYVHGGASLQEIVVPVVHVNKGRTAAGDARPVDFRILQKNDRITTGQLTVELVQDEPVESKILPRTVFVGLWSGNTLISNETPVAFDMADKQIANRHAFATLVLTSDADACNGSNVELRVREQIKGTNQMKTLEQKAVYLLKRGLVADDGFDFM
ncbi:BREX-1 system phosphatase PglZ type A [Bifidobacterium lemurum]|nr:BREX-1 system phosphatase PglZ type A [Bifidobacterium lemurum]QOL34200.1 BREX-1 system phosphatase PglZ type A [Bifidobacterium lemurum]